MSEVSLAREARDALTVIALLVFAGFFFGIGVYAAFEFMFAVL